MIYYYLLTICSTELENTLEKYNCCIAEYLKNTCLEYENRTIPVVQKLVTETQSTGYILLLIPIGQLKHSELIFAKIVTLLQDYLSKEALEHFFYCCVKKLHKHDEMKEIPPNVVQFFRTSFYLCDKVTKTMMNIDYTYGNVIQISKIAQGFTLDFFLNLLHQSTRIMFFNNCSVTEKHFLLLINFVLKAMKTTKFSFDYVTLILALKFSSDEQKQIWTNLGINRMPDTDTNKEKKPLGFIQSFQFNILDVMDIVLKSLTYSIVTKKIYKLGGLLYINTECDDMIVKAGIQDLNLYLRVNLLKKKHNQEFHRIIKFAKNKIIKEIRLLVSVATLLDVYEFEICTIVLRDSKHVTHLKNPTFLALSTIYYLKCNKKSVKIRSFYYLADNNSQYNVCRKLIDNIYKESGLHFNIRIAEFLINFKKLFNLKPFYLNNFCVESQCYKLEYKRRSVNHSYTNLLIDNKVNDNINFYHQILVNIQSTKFRNVNLICTVYHAKFNINTWKEYIYGTNDDIIEALDIICKIDLNKKKNDQIQKYKSLLYNIEYKNILDYLQYILIVPIQDQEIYNSILYIEKVDLLPKTPLEFCKYITFELRVYKYFLFQVFKHVFSLENIINNIKFNKMGIQNLSITSQKINYYMLQHIYLIPQYKNVNAFFKMNKEDLKWLHAKPKYKNIDLCLTYRKFDLRFSNEHTIKMLRKALINVLIMFYKKYNMQFSKIDFKSKKQVCLYDNNLLLMMPLKNDIIKTI